MKKLYFVLPIIAALLVFMGIRAQTNSATKDVTPPNVGSSSEEKALPLSGNKKILVAYFSRTETTREVDQSDSQIRGRGYF